MTSWQQSSWLLKAVFFGLYVSAPGSGRTDDAALLRVVLALAVLQGAIFLPPLLFGFARERQVLMALFTRAAGTVNCMCLAVYAGRSCPAASPTVSPTDAALAIVMSTVHMFVAQSAAFFRHPRMLPYAPVCAWASLASSLYFPTTMLRVIGGDVPRASHAVAIFVAGEVFDVVASLGARATTALGDAYAAMMAG